MLNKFLTITLCASVLAFTSCSKDDEPGEAIKIVIEGASIAPNVGGPNEPNQVYVDLSSNTSTVVQRDTWDLGFSSGENFRVALNGSIYMATAKLSVTDIDAINSTSQEIQDLQPQVAIGTFDPANSEFVDAPDGNILETAIDEISSTDANNPVYLVNLGFKVGTEVPSTGSVAVSGDTRGWKKVRILRNGSNYVLQYADLDDTTHKEVTISKSGDYNFTFFSFDTETEVNVEPKKENWDLNFTVFTNEIEGYGSYGYSDFVVNNTKANSQVYMIDTEVETELSYDNFTLANVDASKFINDQRGVGSSWRNGGGPGALPSLKANVFYVMSDTDGNLYKIKFLALTNADGERGNPEFVYSLLQ